MSSCPLVVDLDGTLVRTDMLHESALRALQERPTQLLKWPWWLMVGRAQLKHRLADGFDPAPQMLPYNAPLLEWLKEQKAQGRKLVLCTASDAKLAQAVASHLGLFDEVMASDGMVNLAGANKARALSSRFGERGFDYAGNSGADLAVWRSARRAIVVNAPAALTLKAGDCCPVERTIPPEKVPLQAWLNLLRVHQWLKNLLLFVPFVAAHLLRETHLWSNVAHAFVAFSLCASSVYIANDLVDLESDRRHPRKRKRPFACGDIAAWKGIALVPLLVAGAGIAAAPVGPVFCAWLGTYMVVTSAYSWRLKRWVLIDCLMLALLYTLRIVAGAAAVGLPLSFWLLAFSVFLFLSLAFVKRFAELAVMHSDGRETVPGRGYVPGDAALLQSMGVASGYAAVVVLALYLNSDVVVQLYRSPVYVWGTVPILLFWISWVWLRAHRGQMHDDPLVFAVKDTASRWAGLLFAACLVLGTLGDQWLH